MILLSITQEKLALQIALKQGLIQELATSGLMVPGWFNYNFIEKYNSQVAKTIMARDYKGFSSGFDSTNGVLEWKVELL